MSAPRPRSVERPIACPACATPMRGLALARRPLGSVHVDLCPACRGLWFDAFESLHLAPEGTLALFREVASLSAPSPAPGKDALACPRCRSRLVTTQDVQRQTRFSYWRCPQGDGRFTPFVQFMREKDFTRPLVGGEIEQVRATIGTVRCSGCGAPVDVGREPSCRYCGARIEVLDAEAIRKALTALAHPRPALPEQRTPTATTRDPDATRWQWQHTASGMLTRPGNLPLSGDLIVDGLRSLLAALDLR